MRIDNIAEMERSVRRLLDVEEIRTLRMRYHACHNEGRSPDVIGLFAPGVRLRMGFMGTSPELLARASERSELMKQMIHNHVVTLDGDRATGLCYMEGRAVFHGRAYVYGGRYDDEYLRTPDGWRFASMRFDPYIFVPFDQDWADPAARSSDPHAGHYERDDDGNIVGARARTGQDGGAVS